MDAIIGNTGFVGSHLSRRMPDALCYNSKNFEDMRGKKFGTIYCAGVSAEKWKANKEPVLDITNISRLVNVLKDVECNTCIVISTIDVLDTTISGQSEVPDIMPITYASHPYGQHRLWFEQQCMSLFHNTYIVRLPALFGKGLKKNALYDLLHNNQLEKLRSHWTFQWYNLEWLYDDILKCISNGRRLVHLITPPIPLSTIVTLFFPHVHVSSVKDSVVNYKFQSIYSNQKSQVDVLEDMARFIRSFSRERLLVSELAMTDGLDTFLQNQGIYNREIIPGKHDWKLKEQQNVYSAQSILFGVDIQIFQEQQRFLTLLDTRLCELAKCRTKLVVFGSPKQRVYTNEDDIGLFRKVGDIAQKYNILVCLEHNSRQYGCNWMTTFYETLAFVKNVNHPFVRVNIDFGSLFMEDETLNLTQEDIHYISHVQVSFPHLKEWDTKLTPFVRKGVLHLHNIGYIGKISLEMLPTQNIYRSIELFLEVLRPILSSYEKCL